MSKAVAKIDEPVVAININQTYRDGINAGELYDRTGGIRRPSPPMAVRSGLHNALFGLAGDGLK